MLTSDATDSVQLATTAVG